MISVVVNFFKNPREAARTLYSLTRAYQRRLPITVKQAPQPPVDLLVSAVSLHKQGNLTQAEPLYLSLLNDNPNNADALQYLGMLKNQQGQIESAIEYFRKALAISPRHFPALTNLGKALIDLQLFGPALEQFDLALQEKNDSPQLWQNRGNVLFFLNRIEEACESYRRALLLNPELIEVHFNLGNLLFKSQQFKDAESSYRRVIAINPNHAEAHNFLGCVINSDVEAETCFRKALSLNSNLAEAHRNLASLLTRKNKYAEAEICLRKAIAVKPDYFEAYAELGFLLGSCNQRVEAKACCRKAIDINPEYAEGHHFLGLQLQAIGSFTEAEVAFRRSIEINPHYLEAHSNFGLLLEEMQQFKQAEACYRTAIAIAPESFAPEMNLGLLLLKQGRFEEGWRRFESRHKYFGEALSERPNRHSKKWQGEPLTNKSFLLWPEQGFGDYIQFVRYAAILKSAGVVRVTLFCIDALKELLKTVDGVDEIITDPSLLQTYDYWSCPMSLPMHLGTVEENIPTTIPYVHALHERIEKWHKVFSSDTTFKVGLVWKGEAKHTNDSNRSLPGLETLAPLWSVPGATFFSLQKGQGEKEAAYTRPSQPIIHLGSDIVDFADTAAIIHQLDLIICVDTAIAHVAGAIGKACWVLLPAAGTDWRWLQKRSDSPWYPGTMRLFRQTIRGAGGWDDVIANVTDELHDAQIILVGQSKL